MSQSFVSVASSRVREAAEAIWRSAQKEQDERHRKEIAKGREMHLASRWFWQPIRELTDGEAWEYFSQHRQRWYYIPPRDIESKRRASRLHLMASTPEPVLLSAEDYDFLFRPRISFDRSDEKEPKS